MINHNDLIDNGNMLRVYADDQGRIPEGGDAQGDFSFPSMSGSDWQNFILEASESIERSLEDAATGYPYSYSPQQLTRCILAGYPPDGSITYTDTEEGRYLLWPESDDAFNELYRERANDHIDPFIGTEMDFQVHILTYAGVSEEAARQYVQGWDK